MVGLSEEEIKLYEIVKNGTKKEAAAAHKKLKEIALREMEEEKKNPPPWGNEIMF